MFSNQLNQLFNLAAYDLPQSIKHGEMGKAFGIITGMTASAVAMGMISRKRIWDKDKEPEERVKQVGTDVLTQLFSAVPVAGSSLSSGLQGYGFMRGTDPLPLAYEVGALTKALQSGKIDMSDVKQIIRTMEAAGMAMGLPVVAARRLRKVFFDDELQLQAADPWELVGGPPED